MTKLKSKKMSKSTIAIIIMAIAMVAMLTFGATFALFTASTRTIQNSVTTGRIALKTNSTAVFTGTNILPGDTLGGSGVTLVTDNTTGSGAQGEYVAVKIALSIKDSSNNTLTFPDALVIDWNTDTGVSGKWAPAGDGIYVLVASTNDITVNDQSTINNYSATAFTKSTAETIINSITFAQTAFDHAQQVVTGGPGSEVDSYTYTNNLMNATVSVEIQFRGVQVANYGTAPTVSSLATYLFGTGSGTLAAELA